MPRIKTILTHLALLVDYLMLGLILLIFGTANWWWRPRWLLNLNIPHIGLLSPLQNLQNALTQPVASDAYQSVYYSRFATVIFVTILVVLWILSGFKGLYRLVGEVRFIWLLSLAVLVGWINFSVGWATQSAAVAQTNAMQWNLALLFVLVVSAVRPPKKWVIYAMLAGMVLQGIVAVGQVAVQSEVGFANIDDDYFKIGVGLVEFDLNPSVSGANVVQSRGTRFLRAHGFTPHPNLLAFGVVMALISSLSLWQAQKRQFLLTSVTVLGLWVLFLSFSRASVGGFVVGVGLYFGLSWLSGHLPRPQWSIVARYSVILAMVGLVFVIIYGDLLATRAGIAEEGVETTIETRSLSDRRVYAEIARQVIREYPIRGIGIGNFVWESEVRLRQDPGYFDLRGSNVHNIYLLALSEIGWLGGGFFALNLACVGLMILSYWRKKQLSKVQIALLASIGAWLAIGWFEFAPWSLFTHQLPFWGVLALALIPEEEKDTTDELI